MISVSVDPHMHILVVVIIVYKNFYPPAVSSWPHSIKIYLWLGYFTVALIHHLFLLSVKG